LPNSRLINEGKWGLAASFDQMRTLRNLNLGIVGFGRIGRAVATRLKAFKCQILVHDPFVSPTEIERADCLPVAFSELFSRADVITLHCPSTAQTRGMVNRESLALMKPGVILINTARGDIVDSLALTEALQNGRVSAAGLDVFAPEPIPVDHPIRKMNNVLLSSHLASCSASAMRKLRETVANLAVLAIRGEPLPSVVNGVHTP
jgi:D-3-phosphoglycerate dehydrogenase